MDEAVEWHNELKPHRGLVFRGHYDTPASAFLRKLPPERTFQYADNWFWK